MQEIKEKLFTFVVGSLALICMADCVISPLQAAGVVREGLENYPKNLARLHLGANLQRFDKATGMYKASEATSMWLDDDEATGWAPAAGKEHYLLMLSQPSLVKQIALSTTGSKGRVTVYAGDERATPDSSTWTPVLRDVAVEDLNEKTIKGAVNRYGKYLLIETNLEEAGPWWSLYVFGREAADEYEVAKRAVPVDASEVFGQRINESTVIDLTNIYSDADVVYMTGGGKKADWFAMVDESPETFWIVNNAENSDVASFAIKLAQDTPIRRVSMTADAGPGVMEFYLVNASADGSQPDFATLKLDEMLPACTLGFDGVSDREAIDIPPVQGTYLVGRWKPTVNGESIKIRQIDAFGALDFNNYAVNQMPAPIAELQESRNDKAAFNDGKTFKTLLDPIAEGPVDSPTLTGLGAPPIFSSQVPPLLTVTSIEDPEPTPKPTPERPRSSSP